ncbi:hypothetical protein FDENT_13551 [Fusarium denticulatum]|uniref:Uncharacterized protein n=1 Tax=Fusarium denticulatum TaxID=48507 RepID=A0A8H5T1Y0_9HYPO|nr:hypothetical protein FDENT_13551 [Fusarium denticulatum]
MDEPRPETERLARFLELFRRYAHHVVWVKYAWSHEEDEAVKEAFRTFVYPTFTERLKYIKDLTIWDNVQRNLETVMEMIVEAIRPFKPFKFDHTDLALIFVAWLIKSKEIIYRDLPNLSGENLVKTWVEITAWLAIIYFKGGKHFEPIKIARDGPWRRCLHLQRDQSSLETYLMPKTACILRFAFAFDSYTFDHLRVKRSSPLLRGAEPPSSGAHLASRTSSWLVFDVQAETAPHPSAEDTSTQDLTFRLASLEARIWKKLSMLVKKGERGKTYEEMGTSGAQFISHSATIAARGDGRP